MATSPSATPTPITPPRVPLIDERTGLIDRAWYLFFLSLFRASETVEDATAGPSTESLIASYDAALQALAQATETQPPQVDCCVSVDAVRQEVQTQPASGVSELAQDVSDLRQQLQTLPRSELGTFAALQQANLPWTTFDTTPESVPTDVGTAAWDGGTTLGIQMTPNVLQRVGESEFVYVKASATITKGQLCYHTGSVGSSGVISVAPTPLALADPNQIIGVAAESIALNDFGLIQISGDLRGFNTTGSSVGETWADGDPLYYNPAYVGSLTKIKPSAPNQKTYVGEVINAGSGGSGAINIRIAPGSVLGGTDSNVEITSVANNDLLVYDSADLRWENKNVTNAFNIPALSANGVLYLNASKVATSGTSLVFDGANFGIGTSGPLSALNVAGTTALNWAAAGNSSALATIGTQGTSGASLLVNTASVNSNYASGLAIDGTYSSLASTVNIKALGVKDPGYASQLTFSTTSGATVFERMRVDTSGNVGIATTAPLSRLNVAGTTALTWAAAGDSSALVTLGTQGTSGGSLLVNTASVNSNYASGLAIDGTYSSLISTVNIKALGVKDFAYGSQITFSTTSSSTLFERMRIDFSGNLALNTTSVGTSAAGVLSVGSGTEPSSGPADTVQFYSVDRSAGNTIPAFYCEGSGVTNAGITNTAVTNKIAMKINGTIYYLLATTNAT